jgi:mannose-6-phosphate isomerase-like protein (cupin superfamily)
VRAVQVLRAAGHYAVPEGEPNEYREHFRNADLSAGTYCIPVGGRDGQRPHPEDETYVVLRGRAVLTAVGGAVEVGPGTVVHVPAGETHRFTDVGEDLSVLVVFAPAAGSRW